MILYVELQCGSEVEESEQETETERMTDYVGIDHGILGGDARPGRGRNGRVYWGVEEAGDDQTARG